MAFDTVTVIARNSAIRARTIQEAEAYIRSRLWALEELAVNELYAIYRDAFERMAGRLRNVAAQYGAGETWSASDLAFRARTEAVLAQIGSELESLNNAAMDATLRASVRGYQAGYYGGAWQLEEGLRTGLPLEIPILPTDAIRAAILEPYIGLTFIDRFLDARTEFERIVRRAIVESQIEGESIYLSQKRLADALGVDIGRRTAAARAANNAYFYRTELIARTEILRASNNGALAIYERNQDVLKGWSWTASRDERVCPVCGALDGQVFRFGGQHLPPPTGSHPRCILPGTQVIIPGGISGAAKSFYSGRCIEIILTDGRRLAVTEDHPILTARGWIAAQFISPTDDIIIAGEGQRIAKSINPDDDYRPAMIEEIFSALEMSEQMIAHRVKPSAIDFNGDRRGLDSNIQIVNIDGLLWNNLEPISLEPLGEFQFDGRSLQEFIFNRQGMFYFCRDWDFDTACRCMGRLEHSLALFGISFCPTQVHAPGNITRDYPGFQQTAAHRCTTNSRLAREFVFRFSRLISSEKVVQIRDFDFSGHVYDLQCEPYELYICNGIITHNCRCTPTPVLINSALEERIVGARQTYREWAAARGITIAQDGGVLYFRSTPPPKSPSAGAAKAAPHLYPRGA